MAAQRNHWLSMTGKYLVPLLVGWILTNVSAFAQQMIAVETPITNVSDSYYERSGVGLNFSIPGNDRIVGLGPDGQPTPNGAINFSFGGFNTAVPPFGGYDPNSEARGGIRFQGAGGGGLGLNFAFGQGSDRTFTQTTPMVVVPNGGTGSVFDGTLRPFVTGVVPVVGGQPMVGQPVAPLPTAQVHNPATVARRRKSAASARRPKLSSSTATTAAPSVRSIKQQRLAAREREIEELLAKADAAEAQGKLGMTKSFLRNAARRAEGAHRAEILDRLERLVRENE